MSNLDAMKATINDIAQPGKGILAADESQKTITKRFDSINTDCTEENRRAYRDLLFTTPGLNQYISGVICFEETLGQKTADGTPLPEVLAKQGIVPGIKVDKGLIPLVNSLDEKTTQGLDGLPERLQAYKKQGARFAKWRVVYNLSDLLPSWLAIQTNAEMLARYAAICQSEGIVPIVEPEVLIDGDHSIERCAEASETVFNEVFRALERHDVILECMILKPSMIVAGKDCANQPSIEIAARETVTILRRTVPAAVPTINFLSGGQTPEQATAHLHHMNAHGAQPWLLSYSYGRALQEPALNAWQGKPENREAAQQALLKRAKLNSAASLGKYADTMESEPAITA